MALLHVLSFFVLSVGWFSTAYSEESLKPALRLNEDATQVPFMDLVLRDADLELRAENSLEAKQFLSIAQGMERELKKTSKGKNPKFINEIMRHYLAVAYFLEDVSHGTLKDKEIADINKIRGKVVLYAKKLVEIASKPDIRSDGAYHLASSLYLLNKKDAFASEVSRPEFEQQGSSSGNKEILLALNELTQSDQTAARERLEKQLPSLKGHAAIAANLLLARSYAGIDDNGQIFGEADQRYREYLAAAAKRAVVLNESQLIGVLQFSLGVWKAAEDAGRDWEKAPFQLDPFKDLREIHAVRERSALALFAKGKMQEAIAIYHQLVDAFKAQPVLPALQNNILEMYRVRYERQKDLTSYISALHTAALAFKNKNVLGPRHQKLAAEHYQSIQHRYRRLVLDLIEQAKAETASPEARREVVKVVNTYLSRKETKGERNGLLESVALLHGLNNDHAKAASIYVELLDGTKGSESHRYLRAAIQSQQILANWPATPPWKSIPAGDKKHRVSLASLYEQLNGIKRSMDWDVLAHLGLLKLSIDESAEAFALWKKAMLRIPKDENASKATGYMLAVYHKAERWGELISLIGLIQKSKIIPMFKDEPLNPQVYFADALMGLGMKAYKESNYKLAAVVLEEFTATFVKDPRYLDALYHKGLAYQKIGKADNFSLAMKEIVMEFPSSKYYQPAINSGMNGAKDDVSLIFFHEAKLKQIQKTKEADALNEKLSRVYIRNKMYREAIRTYEALVQSSHLSVQEKNEYLLKQLKLESDFGDLNKAVELADSMLKNASMTQLVQAHCFGVKARHAASIKQFQLLDGYQKSLEKMDLTSHDVVSNLAYVRLLIADYNAAQPLPEIDSRKLKDPYKEVQNEVVVYQRLKSGYERVCAIGKSEFCEQARNATSIMAKRSIARINSIELPSSFDEKVVKAFESQKGQIIKSMSQVGGSTVGLAR